MNSVFTIIATISYFSLLFIIAGIANRRIASIHRYVSPATIYALSIAVYCTAWTYFGSVGNAAKTGIGFLPVYVGPSLLMPVIVIIWLKTIRICREYRITNIADFIASRYGNSILLGMIVTTFYIIGVIPYIAIQLKAISNCFLILTSITPSESFIINDSTFYISIFLILFTIIYGTRNVDATEKHTGLIAVVAFESMVKLVAFLAVGFYVTYFVFDGPADILQKYRTSVAQNLLSEPMSIQFNPISWLLVLLVSTLAMLLLPRQFQVAVVENTDERHLKRALWLFPLYLLIINIFVIPIALGGLEYFKNTIDADTFVLAFPMSQGVGWLSLFVFLGGFAAASGMVIVETIALTTMLSNSIIIPIILSREQLKQRYHSSLGRVVVLTRRFGIFFVILAAYFFEKMVAERASLVSIGLISFAAVAQVAPTFLGGLYWKQASGRAALVSIFAGFGIWFYTLIIPTIYNYSPLLNQINEHGIFGMDWLKPTAFFYYKGLDVISHGIFWSLLVNTSLFVAISLHVRRKEVEKLQSEAFVGIYQHGMEGAPRRLVREGVVRMHDVYNLLETFLGTLKSRSLITGYATRHKMVLDENGLAEKEIVTFAEKVLAGVIGNTSARMMVSAIANEEQITMHEVIGLVKESQQILLLNKELRKKSNELSKATEELKSVNLQLTKMDEFKDEFLYTVTHELRTPLTSIRALGEVLYDNPDLPEAQKSKYLEAIVKETERMTHLITQVLNLERFESGRQKLQLSSFDIHEMIEEVCQALQTLKEERGLLVVIHPTDTMLLVRSDRDLIYQVVYNLVSNAIRFAASRIDIRITSDEEEVQLSVADDGVGIPEEHQPFIFDKFYQIKHKKLQKPQGSGMGLAISKRIIELHDCRIWVESPPGGGAKFCFTLKLI